VRCNLRALHLEVSRPSPDLDATARDDLIHELRETVGKDVPAYLTARRLADLFKLRPEDVMVVLYQAIWNRQIRVDLFRPVLADSPLRLEREDVLVRYATWFER
jgi:hypothetical protein